MAATPLALPGQTMLPSVSLPNDTAAKFADAAAAEPELELQGLRSMPYGLCVCPPRPDQPLIDSKERKFAHSDRLVLPRTTAPPQRVCVARHDQRVRVQLNHRVDTWTILVQRDDAGDVFHGQHL